MNYWQDRVKIKNLSFPRFIGAPLDGITDSPFRALVRDFSPDALLYTEMRHVATVAHDTGKLKTLDFSDLERPLNFQVAANQITYIQSACEKILARGVDSIDLNVGCPAHNVTGSGGGSALMADLPRLKSIVESIRLQVKDLPFTVKIRAGFKCVNALEVAKMLQDCGVDALAIHPRLQTQRFEGRPNYDLAGEVKKALSIPVFISGGIVNWQLAKMVYERTGVDGFLIGRGMWAKPWKLQELYEHSQGREFQVTTRTVLTYALKHFDKMLAYYGPKGLFCFRKHLPFYLRGLPGASELRSRLVTTTSEQEVREGMFKVMEAYNEVIQ
jgi:tRNA-dihydrouridine synthase B